jgi:hypothetical protein
MPKISIMQNISGFTGFKNTDFTENMVIAPPKYNRSWGADYLLMDSRSFMGGKGGDDYAQIIDMFQKIWDVNGVRLFTGF